MGEVISDPEADSYLDDLTGSVAELKLRCERGYAFFEFYADLQ